MAAEGFGGLIPYAINFSIVAGAAFYYGRKPLQKFVYQRHERQRDLIDSAASAKKNAERRFLEVQNHLKGLTEETRRILQESDANAKTEADQLLKRADADVARLRSDADRIIANEQEQQENRLRCQVLDLALAGAEKTLRSAMKKEDHSAIIRVAKRKIEAEA